MTDAPPPATELLYPLDTYLRSFEATVTAVEPATRSVTLDRTAFYPGGGGQPHDTGALVPPAGGPSWPVVEVCKEGGAVRHVLGSGDGAEGALPRVGDQVRGEIDWPA